GDPPGPALRTAGRELWETGRPPRCSAGQSCLHCPCPEGCLLRPSRHRASLVLASSSAYKRFSELLPKEERENACSARVPKSQILTLPELRANPFQHRICWVFSTSDDRDDSMSFEDFLDMLSVFSDSATSDIKSYYAFRIFDFDDDGTLDRKDLEKLVNCLTGQGEESRLSNTEMEQLIRNILEESDIDKDGTINLAEFQHIVSRSPDFASSFKIVL
uniref:Calcium and integrin binding 1 n=1 Tax=Buteo japonicus TaxID=224669 RepID=A0A8C0BKW5_9AVES